MAENTLRYNLLKKVFKKAVAEMFDDETYRNIDAGDSLCNLEKNESETIESFLGNMRMKFSHKFKEKTLQYDLEHLLDNLDRDIRNGRVSTQCVRDESYISEIFESCVVEEKEAVAAMVEEEHRNIQEQIRELDSKIEETNRAIKELNKENKDLTKESKKHTTARAKFNRKFSS